MSEDNDQDKSANGRGDRRVIQAEIVQTGDAGHDGESMGGGRQRVYFQSSPFFGYWTSTPMSGGCLAPAITFGLFMTCLGKWGLLAAIGFFVFHLLGAALGAVWQARQIMAGFMINPWAWRVGDWVASFLLTAWLAGGFNE